jgi:uncharacterized membrane protein
LPKKINLAAFCLFYFSAGCNHFIHPVNYLAMIPPYFPFKEAINYSSGVLEIGCSLLTLLSPTRKYGMYLTIFLLVAFIPAHIYLIQKGGCVSRRFCFAAWVAWIRLFPFQFILIWWAYKTWKWSMEIK